ncbi:hypothetical protein LFT44_08265 [Arthrobacter sp. FW306-05-C]|uniref:hypothetical protein n=1 Tax=Arthrobacter sp. FW306-05-C TaxID=2879620 RepID=UPI001F394AAD|nr:hypothetical protein [Arthrobacter sp. FW306-05-C]UKA68368.1 hypothetical protein LFT44_08265 [Arthrobacter sp. FW306-05-C]
MTRSRTGAGFLRQASSTTASAARGDRNLAVVNQPGKSGLEGGHGLSGERFEGNVIVDRR